MVTKEILQASFPFPGPPGEEPVPSTLMGPWAVGAGGRNVVSVMVENTVIVLAGSPPAPPALLTGAPGPFGPCPAVGRGRKIVAWMVLVIVIVLDLWMVVVITVRSGPLPNVRVATDVSTDTLTTGATLVDTVTVGSTAVDPG